MSQRQETATSRGCIRSGDHINSAASYECRKKLYDLKKKGRSMENKSHILFETHILLEMSLYITALGVLGIGGKE